MRRYSSGRRSAWTSLAGLMALLRASPSRHSAVMVIGPAVMVASASGHPSASTMTDPATQSTPRSSPVRSQAAMNIRLTAAPAWTRTISAGRSPSGRGNAEQHPVGDLAEAADDDDLVARGQACPQGQRGAVGRLRARLGLGPAVEDVAAGDQLGQDDNARAPPGGGVGDGVGGELTICCRIAEYGGELAAGHDCRVHGIDLLALSFTPD